MSKAEKCGCHDLVCHSPSDIREVRFIPKVGGKGIVSRLSSECRARIGSDQFQLVEDVK